MSVHSFAQSSKHPYFPDLVFDNSAAENAKTSESLTKDLITMDEPSLFELSQNKASYCYRFFWLRTFHHPIALRLTIDPEGTGLLAIKVLSGQGGYEHGKLIINESVPILRTDVLRFLSQVSKAKFWNLSTIEQTDLICLDGAEWVLEGVQAGKYHLVTRYCPNDGSYKDLGLFLLRLSKLKIKEIY